jgi:hypothetical protein
MLKPFSSLQVILFYLIQQGLVADFKQSSGAFAIPVGAVQRFLYELFLGPLQKDTADLL